MVDFEKIGKRILEERKYLHGISQEKMAEDLGMYQADISNMEKAKKGSGITDLSKLDLIAEYFDMPLESLLFGRRQGQMEKYYGTKMQLQEYTKKRPKKHETILRKLMGLSDDEIAEEALKSVHTFFCGSYMVYVANETQTIYSGKRKDEKFHNSILKYHIFVIYQDEVIGCTTAYVTTVMQHVFQPAFENLKEFIWPDVFELNDTLEILNPYWLLYQYSISEIEEEDTRNKMLHRMDELRGAGEDRIIFYVENSYVREDCRRNGIFRMMMDVLKKINSSSMIWLSLEPTSGSELSSEYAYYSTYEASEIGQINLNASIAEHLGFTIDSKTVNRQAERIEEDGTVITETVPVRRTAYFLPKRIRNILNGDRETLAYARARKKTFGGMEEKPNVLDIYQSAWKKNGFVMSIKMVYSNETVYAFARGMDWKSHWLGVSRDNPGPNGEFVETMEKYDRLEDAENSKYYLGMKVAEQLLGAIYFKTVKPEDIQFDALGMNAENMDFIRNEL